MADWTFRQLSGQKKILTLSGWSAPFGRPRKGAVVRDGVQVRVKSTRYPGNNGPPTRHIFGINYQDIELNGRFRDRELGKGNAKLKTEDVKSFVKDTQICDISWGDIIHISGLISEFDPGRESEGEIEWKMKILVDQDNMELRQINPTVPKTPNQLAQLVSSGLLEIQALPTTLPGIKLNVLDFIDDIVSEVTGAIGQLNNIANSISNFEDGLAKEAKRLIAGIHQVKTAILTLMTTIESTQQDSFHIRDSASDAIGANEFIKSAITKATSSLSTLSDLENQCLVALQGDSRTTIRAQQGDTWESISSRVYGGPFEADKIRQANGVRYGRKPEPGAIIVIPAAS